jgi:hypothetical protein
VPAKQNELVESWITREVGANRRVREHRAGILTVLRKAPRPPEHI